MSVTPPFGLISSCLLQSAHKLLHRRKSIEIHLLYFRALKEAICLFFFLWQTVFSDRWKDWGTLCSAIFLGTKLTPQPLRHMQFPYKLQENIYLFLKKKKKVLYQSFLFIAIYFLVPLNLRTSRNVIINAIFTLTVFWLSLCGLIETCFWELFLWMWDVYFFLFIIFLSLWSALSKAGKWAT